MLKFSSVSRKYGWIEVNFSFKQWSNLRGCWWTSAQFVFHFPLRIINKCLIKSKMLSFLICSNKVHLWPQIYEYYEYLHNFVIIRFLHWSPDCFHKKTHQRSTYDWGHEHWTCLPAARWWVRTQEVWEFVQWSGKEPQDSWNIKLWCFWYQFRGGKIIHFNYSTCL